MQLAFVLSVILIGGCWLAKEKSKVEYEKEKFIENVNKSYEQEKCFYRSIHYCDRCVNREKCKDYMD